MLMNNTITPAGPHPLIRLLRRATVLLPALFCLFMTRGSAQTAASYGFSAFSTTYTSVTGGTAANILSDDITQTSVPIGFSFTFCGTPYTTISLCSNGWISFGNVSTTQLTNDISTLST